MNDDETDRYRLAHAVALIPAGEWVKATRGAMRPTEEHLRAMSDREAAAWMELIDAAGAEGRI